MEIKCVDFKSINIYKYDVYIYDSYNKLVFNSETDDRGMVYFPMYKEGLYKIVVTAHHNFIPKKICRNVLIFPDKNNLLIFVFNIPPIVKFKKIALKLVDQNYKGLTITKGEIILWPNHI